MLFFYPLNSDIPYFTAHATLRARRSYEFVDLDLDCPWIAPLIVFWELLHDCSYETPFHMPVGVQYAYKL